MKKDTSNKELVTDDKKINTDKKNLIRNFSIFKQKDLLKKRVIEYLILIFSAFICTLSYDYFISSTSQFGIFPSGLGGLARMTAIYTSSELTTQNFYYFIYLFLFNLPLFIFSIIKISVKFSLKTIVFILLQLVFNSIIAITPLSPNNFKILIDYLGLLNDSTISNNYQLWLFVFAVLAGLTFGYAAGLSYSVNSSTGGTDFISMYISINRKKSIGNINRYINLVILMAVIILRAFHTSLEEFQTIFHDANPSTRSEYIVRYIFGPSLFASLLFIFIQAAIINITYPKYQFRTLFIITKKSDLVIKSMRKIGTVLNDISVWDIVNTQLDNKQDTKGYKTIMCTITLVEYRKVKYSIMKTDPNARVFLQKVDRIAGMFEIRNTL